MENCATFAPGSNISDEAKARLHVCGRAFAHSKSLLPAGVVRFFEPRFSWAEKRLAFALFSHSAAPTSRRHLHSHQKKLMKPAAQELSKHLNAEKGEIWTVRCHTAYFFI